MRHCGALTSAALAAALLGSRASSLPPLPPPSGLPGELVVILGGTGAEDGVGSDSPTTRPWPGKLSGLLEDLEQRLPIADTLGNVIKAKENEDGGCLT